MESQGHPQLYDPLADHQSTAANISPRHDSLDDEIRSFMSMAPHAWMTEPVSPLNDESPVEVQLRDVPLEDGDGKLGDGDRKPESRPSTPTYLDVPKNAGSRRRGSSRAPSRYSQYTIDNNNSTFWEWAQHWTWELTAFFLVVVALLAIVATLHPHEGRPTPQWPFKITINALLSVYAMVFKSALLFAVASCIGQLQWSWFSSERPLIDAVRYDRASRGAWGAVRILWSHKLRQPLTALGALITICSIAVDPIVQQLILPQDCSIVFKNERALLPRTSLYNSDVSLLEVANALNSRVYTQGSENGVDGQCSTGNCTFSYEFNTLAYCSACDDASDDIDTSVQCIEGTDCQANEAWSINTTLPSGLMSYYSNDSDSVNLTTMQVTYESSSVTGNVRIDVLMGKTSYADTGIDVLTRNELAGCQDESQKGTWRCRGYGAATCRLNPCVRTYNASYTGGRLNETLLRQSEPMTWGIGYHSLLNSTYLWAIMETQCPSDEERQMLADLGYDVTLSDAFVPFNIRTPQYTLDRYTTDLTRSLLAKGCISVISPSVPATLLTYLESYFSGFLVGEKLLIDASTDGSSRTLKPFEGPQILQQMYGSGQIDLSRISATFSQMAEGLTEYFRTAGHPNFSLPVEGEVNHYATCVSVRWEWMAFPAGLAATSILFFTLVVAMTRRRRMPVWKSSILAWVYRGPRDINDQGNDSKGPSHRSVTRMERNAEKVVVALTGRYDPQVEHVVHSRAEGVEMAQLHPRKPFVGTYGAPGS
ncbi:hypothetical protein F5Y15DRAFT_60978 [Xylariaceae sp. FL0016]|nr:hypothetical protein F5Y15DRAFT_60978 [Xylariaceae sp. FL0016]